MANDWQSSLQQFLDANPDLPQGDEHAAEPSSAPKRPKTRLQVVIERKGRGGKTATIIAGFDDSTPDEEITSLAARLKQRLGTGGSARGGEILIQGERRKDVVELLRAEGYIVK